MLRFLTAGESHGPELTVILEGMPAGLPLTKEYIDKDLARRQKSEGSGGRMNIEKDSVRITGGVMAGKTTGAPISLVIQNRDFEAWKNRSIPPMNIPRPGHVDLNAAMKYGYKDLRPGLERASARETAARAAAGAVCKALLEHLTIRIGSYVISIGNVTAHIPEDPQYENLFSAAEGDPVRCFDSQASKRMVEAIQSARSNGDTLGGIFECVALNVPTGLGSHVHWDRRLSARLLSAVGSVPAIKGVQFDDAFQNCSLPGTAFHDAIFSDQQGNLFRKTNRAGGLEGGITTGEPIVIRAAMKPISTTMKGIPSVDVGSGEPVSNVYERSDICAVARAAVVAEAMIAYVLADALLEKLGGDNMKELESRFAQLPRRNLSSLELNGTPWQFAYE